jgi:ATP-binding protein involved in chromosome partitioning
MKAIQQLLWQVDWGELDVLVIDLPPGTGDVPLTIAQQTLLHGAIIVTTPQDVALADVRKGVEMFRKLDVPILGIVQNMSYYVCTNCSEKHYLFGSLDNVQKLGIPIIGTLPLDASVSSNGDRGVPRGLQLDLNLDS